MTGIQEGLIDRMLWLFLSYSMSQRLFYPHRALTWWPVALDIGSNSEPTVFPVTSANLWGLALLNLDFSKKV